MGFFGLLWKNNIQKAHLLKISILGQIMKYQRTAQLCSDDSIQILLNSTQFITLGAESNLEDLYGVIWAKQD